MKTYQKSQKDIEEALAYKENEIEVRALEEQLSSVFHGLCDWATVSNAAII